MSIKRYSRALDAMILATMALRAGKNQEAAKYLQAAADDPFIDEDVDMFSDMNDKALEQSDENSTEGGEEVLEGQDDIYAADESQEEVEGEEIESETSEEVSDEMAFAKALAQLHRDRNSVRAAKKPDAKKAGSKKPAVKKGKKATAAENDVELEEVSDENVGGDDFTLEEEISEEVSDNTADNTQDEATARLTARQERQLANINRVKNRKTK